MGMGAAPASGWTISEENIQQIVPEAWDKFSSILRKYHITTYDVADAMRQESDIEVEIPDRELAANEVIILAEETEAAQAQANVEINDALNHLCNEFTKATTSGLANDSALTLELSYYSSDDGDRYDDLEDGAIWLVEGVEHKTPAGYRFADKLEFARWTIFG